MQAWLAYSLLAFGFWGVWGLVTRLAMLHLKPTTVFFYEIMGGAILTVLLIPFIGWPQAGNSKGLFLALLSGVTLILGHLCFLYAIDKGKISTVLIISSLYSILTIVLAFAVLSETVSLRQAVGIVLGLIAMTLISA